MLPSFEYMSVVVEGETPELGQSRVSQIKEDSGARRDTWDTLSHSIECVLVFYSTRDEQPSPIGARDTPDIHPSLSNLDVRKFYS